MAKIISHGGHGGGSEDFVFTRIYCSQDDGQDRKFTGPHINDKKIVTCVTPIGNNL